MSSQRGSTRIPIFAHSVPTHVPIPASHPVPQEIRLKPHEITANDVGKKVRVSDKEGILRFVGNVHFSTGLWCGVELETAVGKHDGCVCGVRYFTCSECRGLMTPLARVSLIDEIAEDAVSGPYSMIFGVNEPTERASERTLIRSDTFDKADFDNIRSRTISTIVNQSIESSDDCNQTVINISIRNRGRLFNISHTDKESKPKVPSELNLSCTETIILKHMNECSERPRSYPMTEHYVSHTTPMKAPTEGSRKSMGSSPIHKCNTEEDTNKRDSLDCDESLGILTPDQMNSVLFMVSRSPSSENIQSLPNDQKFLQKEYADSSIKDFSLLDINQLSTFTTMKSDTTMNLELPLDTEKKSLAYTLARIEQTPSPEELPLDPTPVVDSEPKTEPTQSKTTSNFITSITSITSIDTGYQGDGEMSRPASRGADNSPLTRRPLPRPQPRRPDPMTDSDFYTESDADNHEEHPLRGDRRAQVIDGTLYGADPNANADVFVNNRENMDSSGIFTDLESAKENSSGENDNKPVELDVSPSDSSTKTISDNSQNNSPKPLTLSSESRNVSITTVKEMPTKRLSPTPSSVASSPASVRSPRRVPKEDLSKKYKTPKRNVPSKVKAALESNYSNKMEKKTPPKKTVGRWDAVMNKISKGPGDQMKNNLKDIKSKVFTSVNITNTMKIEQKDVQSGQNKQPNNKLRRLRARPNVNSTPPKSKTHIGNSIHSSLSDLSGASPVKSIGSAKKQKDVVRVTQVLTTTKLSTKPNNNIGTPNDTKKNTSSTIDVKATNKRNHFNSKEKKKEATTKECNRSTNKGGRVSPGTRPPQQQRVPMNPVPRTAEALAVLVQHLVFNLEAFRVPHLKKEVDKVRLDAEEARLSYRQIEEKLLNANARHAVAIEEERNRFMSEISTLIDQNRTTISQLKEQHADRERKLKEQVQTIAAEYTKLQKAHSESMEILREENDAIREEIDEKNARIEKLQAYKNDNEKLKKSYKEQLHSLTREVNIRKQENEVMLNHSLSEGHVNVQEVLSLRAVLDIKQSEIQDLRKLVGELTQKSDMLQAVEDKASNLQAKCEDLTSQLDRKNLYEVQLLQEKKRLEESLKEEANQKRCLVQRNEELQWKLQQNKAVVTKVIEHAEEGLFNRSLLSSSFSERHTPHRYNLERTLSLREKPLNSRSINSGDDNSTGSRKSKNSYDLDFDDISPPSSPKVKGVVEKSDSVSYVLEMDESPDVVASRIVRRSFRNTTPPKNTPTKSPCNKRPRIKTNPLSLSASASAIMSNSKTRLLSSGDYDNQEDVFIWESNGMSTPVSNRDVIDASKCKLVDNLDIDDEHDLHVQIPSLPSEIGRNNDRESLPTPRHLAGEAMIFESNSEDESTTSSSSGQL